MPTKPRTRPGDISRLGEHVAGCGDSRDPAFLRAVVGEGAPINAAFLDPPADMGIGGEAQGRDFEIASRKPSQDAFRGFLHETLGAAARVSREGAVHFVCVDWRHMEDLSAVGHSVYGELLNLCVWNKSNAGKGSLYRSKHQPVFVFKVGAAPLF